jgi:hypothetical protein
MPPVMPCALEHRRFSRREIAARFVTCAIAARAEIVLTRAYP